MARALRIEYPGAFYHVMHRGNAGSDIFQSERDRERFLEYLGKAVERYGLSIHSYLFDDESLPPVDQDAGSKLESSDKVDQR